MHQNDRLSLKENFAREIQVFPIINLDMDSLVLEAKKDFEAVTGYHEERILGYLGVQRANYVN